MADDDPRDSEPPFDAVRAAAEFAAAMAGEPDGAPAPEAGSLDTGTYTAVLEEEIEALKALLADRDAALDAARAKAEAATAEIDRVRARIERSAATTIERERRSVLASFLDVADALDRAVSELDSGGVAPALVQGVQAIRSSLHAALGRYGAKHRPSMGHTFDPEHHEAIATAPATAETPAGTITAVHSEGYVLGEATLRAARVVVAKP